MLKRDISKLGSYATLIGIMIGAGVFVAIGEAGRDAGPSTWLAYLLLGPVTMLVALPYVIFLSTSIGGHPGGAYLHISRTFRRTFPGFIVMWLSWVTYLGVLATLALSVGRYVSVFADGFDPRIIATVCLLAFFFINVLGVKHFNRIQSVMFVVLIVCIALLIIPGLFAIKVHNFEPFMPNGVGGFLRALPILFFAYGGFDALAQTAGEVKNPQQELPRIFTRGIAITVMLYVAISIVTFGSAPFALLLQSTAPVAEAARSFLPFGSQIVAVGALMAFLTTINACMLVPSRLLLAFAEDRVIPQSLACVNERFKTPHVSLIVNTVFAVAFVWTKSITFLIAIAMQATIIMYIAECAAMAALPFVNKKLWGEVPFKVRPAWITAAGVVAITAMIFLYIALPEPFNPLLIGWAALGTAIYIYERVKRTNRAAERLMEEVGELLPPATSNERRDLSTV